MAFWTVHSLSIVNDLKFKQIPLNASIFPNQPTDALVHDGFADTQQRTADEVLCGVRSAMMAKNATKVHVIGHSLGTPPIALARRGTETRC